MQIIPDRYGKINDSFLSFVEENEHARKLAFYGGAGSGKSLFIAQHFCNLLLNGNNRRMLILRKWLPALKMTAYQVIQDVLMDWGVYDPKNHNKSDLIIKHDTNIMKFTGLDNPEKIKSAEFTDIWIEEATDLTLQDFTQLTIRLGRAKSETMAKMFFSFNPIDQYHWVMTEVVDKPDKYTAIHHSTYLDNYQNLSQEFIDELEHLIEIDENYYRVYTLGLAGVLKNIIYTNYVIENFGKHLQPDAYGLDFGFNNPMAMVELKMRDGEPHFHELLYETGMDTNDLIQWMKRTGIQRKVPIYADSAEPDRIEMIRKAGFNIHPAKKDVSAGIDRVKGHKLHIHSGSSNLIDEIRTYKYRETKDGKVLDEPVPFNDHLMDCIRYVLFTMNGPRKKLDMSAAQGYGGLQ